MSISHVLPRWVIPGGSTFLEGDGLPLPPNGPPIVQIGDRRAHVTAASVRSVRLIVPPDTEGGLVTVRVDPPAEGAVEPADSAELLVAAALTRGVHQVDNPAFDGLGRLYVTHSGDRSTKVPVPIFRVRRSGEREPVPVSIANPTSLALGPDGAMYVSSRFEANVYRLTTSDHVEVYAAELGVPTGLAFARSGDLYVGDRSGSIMRISAARTVENFATLPSSVAAFHLAFGPDDCLYVAAPTLSSRDVIYRITPDRRVDVAGTGFGRPQGIAFDSAGLLYVVDALAGATGVYRVDITQADATPELIVSAASLVGIAFDPDGGLILASADTIWRLDVPLKPLSFAAPV